MFTTTKKSKVYEFKKLSFLKLIRELNHVFLNDEKWRKHEYLKWEIRASGQDGGIGRHASPPHITIELQLDLKTNNTQICQKI